MTRAFDVVSTPLDRGTLLLEASAGTGKTWSLTSIAVRLILEQEIGIEEILLVTFTRKATDELRQRLRDRLHETERVLRGQCPPGLLEKDDFLRYVDGEWGGKPEALGRVATARRDVDLARVRTIHGFCQELLAEGAFEAALPLDGAQRSEGEELLEMAWNDTLREFVLAQPPLVALALRRTGLDKKGFGRFKTAMREAGHRWLPEPRPVDDVLGEYRDAVGRFDIAALAAFAQTVPPKAWNKPGREKCLPTIELLAGGPDPDREDHGELLLGIDTDFFDGALSKRSGEFIDDATRLTPVLASLAEANATFFVGLQQSLFRLGIERYQGIKERLALIDHDDVIARTRDRLMDPKTGDDLARRIGRSFRAALVDEFQDTDGAQWDVFRRIFTPMPGEEARHVLVLVGDPKQAIYRFRGADIYAYLRARDAAGAKATLTRNWRSTPGLVDAVNAIFGRRAQESFGLEQIGFEPVEAARERADDPVAPMQVVWVDIPDGANEALTQQLVLEHLADDVVARRAEVPVGEGRQLAVLVQMHRQARAVMRALQRRGITAVLARGGDIHDSEAMREWRVILRALLDPSNLKLQRRARATRIWGTPLSGLGAGSPGFEDIELLARLRRAWMDEGVATMAASLLGERHTIRRCLGEENGERMVTDLRHGLELLNREESERGLGPEALLRWAESEARSENQESEERPLRLDRQSDAVQILTNFTSKGLEFDTVFLPFAWYRRAIRTAPPLRAHDADGRALFDFREDSEWASQALLEEVASDLRMHYVELTRAKERCVVYLAPNPTFLPHTASAFLLARPEAEPDEDRARWMERQRAALEGAVHGARDVISERLAAEPSIGFREGAVAGGLATETAPRILAPAALAFPASRLRALVPWRQLSYTALVHALHERLDGAPVELPLSDRADPSDAPPPSGGGGIFGFARGARAGICLHELLEKSEFTRAVDDDDRTRVRKLLARHGLDLEAQHPGEIDPVEVCLDLVGQVRSEGLPFGDATFGDLAKKMRLDEWQFNLPVVDLVPARIAELVRRHWTGEEWVSRAAERLSRLPSTRLQGMLGGFVDLLFTDGEKWTVLDWKSNDLGASVADYGAAAMRRAMIEHDYVVQLLFYLVATHRFLGTRIADYDYDRHVAGASYVFLRGLCGDPAYGWCNVSPPRELIEAIDDLFAGGRA